MKRHQMYLHYAADAEFRASCIIEFFAAGVHGKAYRVTHDGMTIIVRHNYDGTFTWL